jgi:hypothetical protein
MRASLEGFNAVVLASVFNPSVFRDSWLRDAGVLEDDEPLPGFLFSDQAVHLPTARFTLTVVPPQLQFAPSDPATARPLVPRIVGELVRRLPHTPLTAVGLNYVWNVDPEDAPMPEVTRRLFLPANSPLAADFAADDALFGLYCSKNVDECRLRLNIKPLPDQKIQFSFNFHRDVNGPGSAEAICAVLDRWVEFETLTTGIVNRAVA